MKANIGNTDKVIRILGALIIIGLYFANIISGTLALVLLLVGIVLLATSMISFCPIYYPFGINTRKKKAE